MRFRSFFLFALLVLPFLAALPAPSAGAEPLVRIEGRRFIRFSFAVSTALVEEALAQLEPWFAAQPRLMEASTPP